MKRIYLQHIASPTRTTESSSNSKSKSSKGTIGSISSNNGISSNLVMQDVLSIKSYLHKLSRLLQVIRK